MRKFIEISGFISDITLQDLGKFPRYFTFEKTSKMFALLEKCLAKVFVQFENKFCFR